jgi:carbon-monoxide dehydrogenase large subunit
MTAHEIKSGRYIGQRVQRKEDARLLSGRGQFVDDISLPGMLHVAFARSPIARGAILSIKTEGAREVAGVHAILTQQDLARFKVDMINFFLLPPELPITPLARDRVCYVGEPVALVIADSRHIAEDAASLIEVEYAEEDPIVSLADARHGPLVHPNSESNIVQQMGEEEPGEELEAL